MVDPGGSAGGSSSGRGSRFSGPQTIGPFRVLELLGRGAVGSVYRVQAPDGRVLALKLLNSAGQVPPQRAQRFEREARVLERLKHPQIVPLRGFGQHSASYYLLTDLVEGEELHLYAQRHQLGHEEAALLLAQIARIVQTAHEQGVVHRDLKPSNVRVDTLGRPFLLDFGLAFELGSAEDLTQSGAMIGTPAYMPPELVSSRHGSSGPWTDVYALGAMLHELLCGQVAFPATAAYEYFRRLLNEDPPGPRVFDPSVSLPLDQVCKRAMARDPQERYATAGALAAAIEDALRTAPPTRSKAPAVFVVAILVGVLGALGFWLTRGGDALPSAAPLASAALASPTLASPAPRAEPPASATPPTPTPSSTEDELPEAEVRALILGAFADQSEAASKEGRARALALLGERHGPQGRYLRGLVARGSARWKEANEALRSLEDDPRYLQRAALALLARAIRDGQQELSRELLLRAEAAEPPLAPERCAARLARVYGLAGLSRPFTPLEAERCWSQLAAIEEEGLLGSSALELEYMTAAAYVARCVAKGGKRREVAEQAIAQLAAAQKDRFPPLWEASCAGDRALVLAIAGNAELALPTAEFAARAYPSLPEPPLAALVIFALQGRFGSLAHAHRRFQSVVAGRSGVEADLGPIAREFLAFAREFAGGKSIPFLAELEIGSAARIQLPRAPGRGYLLLTVPKGREESTLVLEAVGAEADVDMLVNFDGLPETQACDHPRTSYGYDEVLMLGPQATPPLRAGVYTVLIVRSDAESGPLDLVLRARILSQRVAQPAWTYRRTKLPFPPGTREQYQAAMRLEAEGRLRDAEKGYRDLIQVAPEAGEVLLIDFYERSGRDEDLLRILDARQEPIPDAWRVLAGARALRRKGQAQAGLVALEKVLAVEANLLEAQLEKLECLAALGRYEEGEALAFQLIRSDPSLDDVQLWYLRAQAAQEKEGAAAKLGSFASDLSLGTRTRRGAIRALLARGELEPAQAALGLLLREATPLDRLLAVELRWRRGEREAAQRDLVRLKDSLTPSALLVQEITRVGGILGIVK